MSIFDNILNVEAKLCLYIIYDDSEDIYNAIQIDIKTLKDYCDLKIKGKNNYDILLDNKLKINDSDFIFDKLKKYSRVIIWYTGHGFNLEGDFPCFESKNNYIIEEDLYNDYRIQNFNLFIIVYDCCNTLLIKDKQKEIKGEDEKVSTLFDYIGKFMISSAKKRNKSNM